tara:strand:+ start:389 stop:1084 length:696 start_codon:yes stop_codon:yes gene_type:complete
MLPSINKYRLYLYIFFFICLTSIFNFNIFEYYQNKFSLKKINLNGLNYNEKKIVMFELNKFKNSNIFNLSKDDVLGKLTKFNFLEKIYVHKILPSSVNINLSKTPILGKTIINGVEYFIGKNGNLINSSEIFEKNEAPQVFGEFEIEDFLNLNGILNNHHPEVGNVKKYFFFKNKRWDLLFSNDLMLKLPSKKVDDALKIYKKLLNNDNLINVKVVDLRIANQIILTNNNE